MGTAAAAGPTEVHERRGASDATGVALLGACAAWALITAGVRGGSPEGVLLAVLAVAAGYAGGRICGALLPVAAPCAGALVGLGLAAAAPHVPLGLTSPLGLAGATAALLVLAAGAACCAAWAARTPSACLALRLLAVGITGAAAALGSLFGFVGCAVVLLCSLATALTRRRAPALAVLAVSALLVTGVSVAVADETLPDGLTAPLEGQLGRHRVLLWQDALGLATREPAMGVGPGRFGEVSPVHADDVLADGKPHSAPLQLASEQGVVGAALLAAVFCWLLYALWRSPRSTQVVLSAGAALTALTAVAAVGNALSVTAVTTGAGVLAGIATARPLTDEPRAP
ncbi:O-antigen ligase domain-containing protein [Streptomyces kanamyceticus]|uniref:O-antigen ligase domain-containing protein n=2 Tax=Streptomyces kanamyceticus TaxID=1967 RepID=A0A5J6GPQ1_STRKN|nr:O-antigen ligase family protein [Streptomyces kanamyceticus]QEU96091.1 O-antigen ligase domain-containing protein [Streptomyces kanamyceticus]